MLLSESPILHNQPVDTLRNGLVGSLWRRKPEDLQLFLHERSHVIYPARASAITRESSVRWNGFCKNALTPSFRMV